MTLLHLQARVYLGVAIGGALGSIARYLATVAALALAGPFFPWGTLIVNVLGSLLIGLYFTLTEPDGRLLVGPAARQFMLVGFCGGFTTFSVFSLETLFLARGGAWGLAGLFVASSLALWLVAVWIGQTIGIRINRRQGGRE
jgi:fluoride exporter